MIPTWIDYGSLDPITAWPYTAPLGPEGGICTIEHSTTFPFAAGEPVRVQATVTLPPGTAGAVLGLYAGGDIASGYLHTVALDAGTHAVDFTVAWPAGVVYSISLDFDSGAGGASEATFEVAPTLVGNGPMPDPDPEPEPDTDLRWTNVMDVGPCVVELRTFDGQLRANSAGLTDGDATVNVIDGRIVVNVDTNYGGNFIRVVPQWNTGAASVRVIGMASEDAYGNAGFYRVMLDGSAEVAVEDIPGGQWGDPKTYRPDPVTYTAPGPWTSVDVHVEWMS